MFKKLFKEFLMGIFISGMVLLIPTIDVHAQDMRKMELVYTHAEMNQVEVQKGIVYKSTEEKDLTIDLYAPPSLNEDEKLPVVIFALGYPDFKLKDMQSYISWGKLVALHDMIGINYETSQPVDDLTDLIAYLRENADKLNIDKDSIGIWSCSGNVPVALSHLYKSNRPYLKFGVLYYGIMNTPDKIYQQEIVELSSSYGFINPPIEPENYLPEDLPLLVVRSGRDNIPNINNTIDHFTTVAISKNMPLTLINYSEGQHAFDIMDDKEESRRIIKQTLSFMSERFTKHK